MPHVRPFHFGLSVVSANFQMMSIANKNSMTEEQWIAQVGMERALIGSECMTKGKLATVSSGKFPIPNKKGEWTSKPRPAPVEHAAAKRRAPTMPMILGVLPNLDPDDE